MRFEYMARPRGECMHVTLKHKHDDRNSTHRRSDQLRIPVYIKLKERPRQKNRDCEMARERTVRVIERLSKQRHNEDSKAVT